MEDLSARLEKLLTEAEDCDLIGKLATDLKKRALFQKLASDLRSMARGRSNDRRSQDASSIDSELNKTAVPLSYKYDRWNCVLCVQKTSAWNSK